MEYSIDLPKILYLTLLISKFAKNKKYYNTNDLIKIANEMRPELVRTRKDKNDYKFLDDTNFGGLRGNFSTLLTWNGYIKKNNRFSSYYGLGKNDRLFNAVKKGEIILDHQKYRAYTNNSALKKALENEIRIFSIKESQAHIKIFLEKIHDFNIERDFKNFPKISVLKSTNEQYFLRIIFNTFISDDVVEFRMHSYFEGNKIKATNIHPLFVVPSYSNAWESFYVLDCQKFLTTTPQFVYYDKKKKIFYDNLHNTYTYYELNDGLKVLSNQSQNRSERLSYSWESTREKWAQDAIVDISNITQSEYSIFVKKFLNWTESFNIFNKKVVKIIESSNGGADVILVFSGGTTQKLELEHKWENYIRHKHYTSLAWRDAWLFADEEWNFDKIVQIFSPYLSKYIDNIPKVFLCVNKQTGEKEAYEIDWNALKYTAIQIND